MKPKTKENKTKKQLFRFSILLIMLFFAFCPGQASYSGIIGEKDTTIILFIEAVNTLQEDVCNIKMTFATDQVRSLSFSRHYSIDLACSDKQNGLPGIRRDFACTDKRSIICISERNSIIVDKNRDTVLE